MDDQGGIHLSRGCLHSGWVIVDPSCQSPPCRGEAVGGPLLPGLEGEAAVRPEKMEECSDGVYLTPTRVVNAYGGWRRYLEVL